MSYNINNTNLLYYYPFDKDLLNYKTGTGVNDTSSANVAINTLTTKLLKGNAYFPGMSGEYIQLPSTTFSTNGISFALWMEFPVIPSSSYTSVFEFGSGINNKNIILYFNAAQLYFTIYNPSSGTAQTNYYLNYTLTDTNWHHYCINISSAGVWSLYVDGVQISGIDFTAYPATTALTTCYLAKTSFQTTNLSCYMNQFLVFNRVLTTNEIQNLSTYPWLVSYSSSASSSYTAPPTTGNYNLFGKFDSSYVVTNQVLTNQTYGISCMSSNGKNLVSAQGTYPNFTIYYSTNYGQTWALSNAPTTIHSIFCSPKNNPDVFYVGAANGAYKLYRSADGGATWTLISTAFINISGLSVNDADTILYLSNFNVGLYYSTATGNTSFNYSTNTGTFTFNLITGSNSSTQYGQMTCTPDGMLLYGSSSSSNRAFSYNFNNTSSFNGNLANSFGTNIQNVAMSSDGTYRYAILYNSTSGLFIRSTNSGSSFAISNANVLPKNTAAGVSCDPTGQYVQINETTNKWYISSDYGVTFSLYSGSLPTTSIPSIFNNNQFIALVQNTATQYGPITTPSYSYLSMIKWVAGGVGNLTARLSYSTDGISWSNSLNGTTILGYQVYGVAHNGSIWVAGGDKTGFSSAVSLGYSYDAYTWYPSYSGNSVLTIVNAIAYANGKFVAVGSGSSYSIAYSTDGITWTGCAPSTFFASTGYGTSVVYNNSLWVAGGTIGSGTGNKLLAYSPDGINWTMSNFTTLDRSINSIDFNGTRWVAVGNNSSTTQIVYSANTDISGTWTAVGNTFGGVGRGVKWDGTKFIATGQTNLSINTSTDGITWTTTTPANLTAFKFAINWFSSNWVIGQGFSTGNTCLLYSSDGTTWIKSPSNPVGTDANASARALAYAYPYAGTAPTITNVTSQGTSLYVYFTPGTGSLYTITTYYYSLNGGATYTNANTTTSPIVIPELTIGSTYSVTIVANNSYTNSSTSNIVSSTVLYPCFLQGTKILTMNPETNDEEYVPIENLRRGDLIKTSLNGYKAISYIGRAILPNPASDKDNRNRLYKFPKANISGMRDDLYITGEHCTLHSRISEEMLMKTREHMGDIYVTEKKIRVPACIDERAKPYNDDGPVTIWHFALEHNNAYFNYGVYANGLLVESCSIEHLVNRSNMELI